MTDRNILYIGDSIMGQAPSEGYIHHLAKWVYNKDSSSRHHFLNIGGDGSADVLSRIENETRARLRVGIRAFVIGVGLVDAGFHDPKNPEVTLTGYSDNMNSILDYALTQSRKILVSGLTKVDPTKRREGKRNFDNARTAEFDSKLREICREKGALHIPLYDVLTPSDLIDGIHPNDLGHEKIFKRILQEDLSLLLP